MAGGDRDASGGRVPTVLRGDALREARATSDPAPTARVSATTAPQPSTTTGGGQLINGVPASAAMHCCGRGCAHCRIYWNRPHA